MGTVIYFDMPNIDREAAIPANSATVVAKLAIKRMVKANNDHFTPKFYLISSPKPFWVTTPILAHIS